MAIAADYMERAQIVIEPRDGVPRDDGPAGRAAPRTPAGSTPPTEKIPSVGAKHISDCRVDGVEVKVVDSIAAPAFHRRGNRAMLQELRAPSLDRPRVNARHRVCCGGGSRNADQTSHDPEASRQGSLELVEKLLDPQPAERRDRPALCLGLVAGLLSQCRLALTEQPVDRP